MKDTQVETANIKWAYHHVSSKGMKKRLNSRNRIAVSMYVDLSLDQKKIRLKGTGKYTVHIPEK